MKARAVLVVAGGVIGAIVLAAAATTTAPQIVGGPPQIDALESSDRTVEPPTVPRRPRAVRPTSSDREAPPAVSIAFAVLFAAAVAAFVGFAIARAIHAWRNRPRLLPRPEPADWDDVEVHDGLPVRVADRLSADAGVQQAALARGSARNGIVECWLRLETAIVDAGLQRRPSDTSAELTERVLVECTVDRAAIGELSSLYREARFSSHPMGETERAAAVAALGAVHAGLHVRRVDRPRAAAASVPAGGGSSDGRT